MTRYAALMDDGHMNPPCPTIEGAAMVGAISQGRSTLMYQDNNGPWTELYGAGRTPTQILNDWDNK